MDAKALQELVDGILTILIRGLFGLYCMALTREEQTRLNQMQTQRYYWRAACKETENRLSDLIVDLNLKYDKVFSVIDIDYSVFQKWEEITPFYKNVNKEGVVLWKAAQLICQSTISIRKRRLGNGTDAYERWQIQSIS